MAYEFKEKKAGPGGTHLQTKHLTGEGNRTELKANVCYRVKPCVSEQQKDKLEIVTALTAH